MPSFGRTPRGQDARLFTLENSSGIKIEITDFGGAVMRWWTPDRAGRLADIVLGFDSLDPAVTRPSYFGALIGRFANRIADGRFVLDGKTYSLAHNNRPAGHPCHLHGGFQGFNAVLWRTARAASGAGSALQLHYRSADGDEGYPGNLDVSVNYTLTPAGELRIDYLATTDRLTPINLTNHTFFNLAGEGSPDIGDHILSIHATHFTPVTAGLIPTGEIMPVAGTPLDFRTPQRIGARIDADDEQLRFARGYDHNFVLDALPGRLALAASVFEPRSGRWLEVLTTEPGLQFYSGNFLDGSHLGKNGHRYGHRSAFCLETQHFPDSPNQPSFPSTILRPGEVFRSTTVYRTGVEAGETRRHDR